MNVHPPSLFLFCPSFNQTLSQKLKPYIWNMVGIRLQTYPIHGSVSDWVPWVRCCIRLCGYHRWKLTRRLLKGLLLFYDFFFLIDWWVMLKFQRENIGKGKMCNRTGKKIFTKYKRNIPYTSCIYRPHPQQSTCHGWRGKKPSLHLYTLMSLSMGSCTARIRTDTWVQWPRSSLYPYAYTVNFH